MEVACYSIAQAWVCVGGTDGGEVAAGAGAGAVVVVEKEEEDEDVVVVVEKG